MPAMFCGEGTKRQSLKCSQMKKLKEELVGRKRGNVYMKKWKQSATHSHTRNSVEVIGQMYATTPLPAGPVIP